MFSFVSVSRSSLGLLYCRSPFTRFTANVAYAKGVQDFKQKKTKNEKREIENFKKTSPSARRKSHHTALSNAAACNSQCPSTVVSIDDNGTVHALHLSVNIGMIWGSSGSNAAAPVTPREPIFTKREKTCPDSSPTRMQNFTPLAFSAAEKSVTVQTKNKQTKTQ